MTPSVARTIVEEEVSRLLAQHASLARQMDAVLQLDLLGEGGGTWHLDLTGEADVPKLKPGPAINPDCAIRIASSDFIRLIVGQDDWSEAFVTGRIGVSGDLVKALKIRKLFGSVS